MRGERSDWLSREGGGEGEGGGDGDGDGVLFCSDEPQPAHLSPSTKATYKGETFELVALLKAV